MPFSSYSLLRPGRSNEDVCFCESIPVEADKINRKMLGEIFKNTFIPD